MPCGIEEPLAVAVTGTGVEQQHRPAAGGEFLVIEMRLICGAVPRVVRTAVDV
jgi:hypothetical protein